MARKQLERLLSEAAALADRLTEGDSSLAPGEVNELLKEAGYEPDALRRRLHECAGGIAERLRASCKPVPRYLAYVIEASAPLELLAARNPKVALERVRGWVSSLAAAAASGAAPVPKTVIVMRAYRKTTELLPEDARLLDELEDEVKARAGSGKKEQGGSEEKE